MEEDVLMQRVLAKYHQNEDLIRFWRAWVSLYPVYIRLAGEGFRF